MKPKSLWILGLAAATVLASCTSADLGGSSTTPDISTTAPGDAPATTAPLTSRNGPFAPDPDPARGSGLSFNESAGCGTAQGIRGPYATISGDLPDTEAIRGPWGSVYGRDFGEVRSQLQQVEMPMTGDQTVTVWIHSAARPAFDAAVANLEREQAYGNYYEIRAGDVSSFRPSTVPPKRYLSFHAVGVAIDINTSTNPYRADNALVTDMPDWFVRAWIDAGWCWGGDWQTIKDPMHFSWQGPLHTAGAPAAAPAPVRTQPEPFLRAISLPTSLGPTPDGAHLLMSDLDRDGAPDAVRLRPWTTDGTMGVGDLPGHLRLSDGMHPPGDRACASRCHLPHGRRDRRRPPRSLGDRQRRGDRDRHHPHAHLRLLPATEAPGDGDSS